MADEKIDRPEDLKVVLYLPSGTEGAGFVLLVKDQRDLEVVAEYSVGQVEILLALNRALAHDTQLAAEVRGWRSPAAIGAALHYALEALSLRRNVRRINRVFRAAVGQKLPDARLPPLLTSKRGVGIRLTWPLEVQFPPPDSPDGPAEAPANAG